MNLMRKWPSVLLLFVLWSAPAAQLAQAQADPWPTTARQLKNAHVQPGSALEALVLANQDFARYLPSAEANDGRALPPWIRVMWRKAHPEARFQGGEPFSGYPLFLNEIYEWLVSHQDLKAGPADLAALEEKAATVGANQRISGLQTTPRSESDIRIDIYNPNKIVAASNNIISSGSLAIFSSQDGGASWGQTSLPLVSPDVFQGDPAVEWTSSGVAWALALGLNATPTPTSVQLRAYKSLDFGVTWTLDGTVSGTQTSADKEMIWVDHSATARKDTVYAVWTQGPNIFVNSRPPAGAWGTPLVINASSIYNGLPGADIKVNSAGDVLAFWTGFNPVNTSQRGILVQRSSDGGATFTPDTVVAGLYGNTQIGIPAMTGFRKPLMYVTTGTLKSATKNLVHVAWTDMTGAVGCSTPANAPGTNVLSTCKTRIWFARSTDGGVTWGSPVMVNNGPGLNDQFAPHLVVDEGTGVVGLAYYDTIADPGRKKTDVWYQSSGDDGLTWGAAQKVTSAQTDETAGGADLANLYGDYNGMAGFGGVFFPSWTDRRNGVKEEIFTAAVQENAPVIPPFDTVGAGLVSASFVRFYLRLGHESSPGVIGPVGIDDATTGDPIAGDWNGDGVDSIGILNPLTATFKLANHNSSGPSDLSFVFGTPSSRLRGIAGDWDGNGVDTIGTYLSTAATFALRNSNSAGAADATFVFTGAASSWVPIAGDWNGDGISTVGLYDPATSTFYLRNSNTAGGADVTFVFGTPPSGPAAPNLIPLAGDWDGDGIDSVGVFNPSTSLYQLRNANTAGSPDHSFAFSTGGVGSPKPIAGNWDGL